MRIIAGKYRGINIKLPNSKLVRPTTSRNKEAIFNFLSNRIDFEGIAVCDIFAGSGSLGLEALSRGAAQVHFVEKNYKVSRILKENISGLKAGEFTKIIVSDAVKFSKSRDHLEYDLILADPPFFKFEIHQITENIMRNNFLVENGLLLIERSKQTEENDVQHFKTKPVKRLGDSLIYLIEMT